MIWWRWDSPLDRWPNCTRVCHYWIWQPLRLGPGHQLNGVGAKWVQFSSRSSSAISLVPLRLRNGDGFAEDTNLRQPGRSPFIVQGNLKSSIHLSSSSPTISCHWIRIVSAPFDTSYTGDQREHRSHHCLNRTWTSSVGKKDMLCKSAGTLDCRGL